MFLYGFSLIPYGIFNIVSLNLYDFGNNFIIEGKFDRVCCAPVSSLFQSVVSRPSALSRCKKLPRHLLFMVGFEKAWSALDTGQVCDALFFGTCAAIIYISISCCSQRCAFGLKTALVCTRRSGNVIAFGRYPLSIYSGGCNFSCAGLFRSAWLPSIRACGCWAAPCIRNMRRWFPWLHWRF